MNLSLRLFGAQRGNCTWEMSEQTIRVDRARLNRSTGPGTMGSQRELFFLSYRSFVWLYFVRMLTYPR